MNILQRVIICFLILWSFFSCQKVIDIDLEEGTKRLVVEANIDWKAKTKGNCQQIKLSKTEPFFYKGEPMAVSGAIIKVIDENGREFVFKELLELRGTYENTNFYPVLGMEYTLHILYKNRTYTASDTMNSVPLKLHFEQKNDGGLFGKSIEIRGYFSDVINKKNNFYVIRIDKKAEKKPSYIALDGNNFKDNHIFFIYSNKDLKPKDTLQIRVYSVTSNYYNYYNQILGISQGGSGQGPFSTPPAIVRGNIVNQENIEMNPLGAFRTTQYIEKKYIIR